MTRIIALLAGLFFAPLAQSDSALTDENFGGVGGIYHMESQAFEGVALVEALILPVSGQDFDVCFWFRTKSLADQEWEYLDDYKCAPLQSFPSQSVGCRESSHCFTANLKGVDYFFDFSPDYHLVDYLVWKGAGVNPNVFRLYRKQGANYESWLRELSEKETRGLDDKTAFQMYGTGFVVNQHYVVTADHILRDKPSGRQCNKVDVLTYPDEKWARGRIHGVDPFLDVALIKLTEPKTSTAKLSFDPGFTAGDPVSHYSFSRWSDASKGLSLSSGRIIPNQLRTRTDLTKTTMFSDLPGQKGDSGGAMLDSSGHVVGVLLGGEKREDYVYGLKSTVLAGFLKANRVSFEMARSTETLTPEEIELKAKTFTAFVRCQHRIAISAERNKNLEADRR